MNNLVRPIQRAALEKMWLKLVEQDLENQRLATNEAKNIAINRQEQKRIVTDVLVEVSFYNKNIMNI